MVAEVISMDYQDALKVEADHYAAFKHETVYETVFELVYKVSFDA